MISMPRVYPVRILYLMCFVCIGYSLLHLLPVRQNRLRGVISCESRSPNKHFDQRGNYSVHYNYIIPKNSFRCNESITYTTHGDWTFLDNLIPLGERWEGPISVALYAPGGDFESTVKAIFFYRECTRTSIVKDYVTFHLFYDNQNKPNVTDDETILGSPVCSELMEYFQGLPTYKQTHNLTYPVNVARNIAKEMANTYFVLPSDIELYPSPNLIPAFLQMIHNNGQLLRRTPPKVFVLNIFEVEANVTHIPETRKELVKFLDEKLAIPFHAYICPSCHEIPRAKAWIKNRHFSNDLKVFHVGKRHSPFQTWEPIYIGTKDDPEYDERLSWEGQADKMSQAYVMCLLGYEFHILDNAFLTHRPGIKKEVTKTIEMQEAQKIFIQTQVQRELTEIYGTRAKCKLY